MIEDDRGRVPFALIGALLLVSSAALTASVGGPERPTDPQLETGFERTTAESRTAIRDAVADASAAAARNPVIDPANTTAGRAINESGTFRDALRLRVYVAARERLSEVGYRRDGIEVRASLPATQNTSALRAAKRRVHLAAAGDHDTAIRVRIENVTVTARRNGRIVSERRISPEMVVATPVLAMHDRVESYQRRLEAPVSRPGLSRRVTAQLYAIAWARGYAQYEGLAIDNVVTNRHVALSTNAALLDVQRRTVGASDANGRRTLAVATARTAVSDVLGATGRDSEVTDALLSPPTEPPPERIVGLEPSPRVRRDDEMTVAVNATAERAMRDLLGRNEIDRTVDAVYAAEARLVTRVEGDRPDRPAAPSRPGPNWTLVTSDQRTSRSTSTADLPPPDAPEGWHRLETFDRRLTVERIRTATWRRGTETRTTRSRTRGQRLVSLAVVGRHATSDRAPEAPIANPHERGAGDLGGPNLADVRDRAVDRLIDDRGGPDAVARRAAAGWRPGARIDVDADRPAGLRAWIYEDLITLRERVRDVAVTVPRGRAGSFQVNPARRLADRLRDRRAALASVPATYDSAADKARVTVRTLYLDRVIARLEARADARERQAASVTDRLADAGVSMGTLEDGLRATRRPPATRQPGVPGPAGRLRFRVDSAPSYLTLAELDESQVPAVDNRSHPLVVRNRNAATIPYGDVSNGVVDALFGGSEGVRLTTAAHTLQAADATLDGGRTSEHEDLAVAVLGATDHVRSEYRSTLADHGVGDSESERRAIVTAALARWNGTAARALAVANGSASRPLARTAARRTGLSDPAADELYLDLEAARRDALTDDEARPSTDVTDRVRSRVQDRTDQVAEHLATEGANRTLSRLANRSFGSLPAGVPLAPPAYPWVVTTNVWHVQIRGEYARFGLRADRGRPTTPGSDTVYARDGGPVTLDVDDDGEPERLGRSTRVHFSVSTVVVVVVPGGGTGVGDVDGQMDERSGGWPDPG